MPTTTTFGSRNAPRQIVGATSLVFCVACSHAADMNQDGIGDIGLLVPRYGLGPGQHAELTLDNRNCQQDLVASVTTTNGKGLSVHCQTRVPP